MDIIEKVRGLLQSFPRIAEVCNTIHVDFADPDPTSYGLSSTGDTKLSEDILGNQVRQHSFMLYSTFSGMNDYERLNNSQALTELSQWLEKQIDGEVITTVDGVAYSGVITNLKAENGMLYSVPQENTADGVQYQLQVIAEYTVNTI